jgi:hypothetical protein
MPPAALIAALFLWRPIHFSRRGYSSFMLVKWREMGYIVRERVNAPV